MMSINPNEILLIHLRRIGDVLMTTPAVRALKKRFCDAKITFLTESPCDEIFRNNPNVDEVLVYNPKLGLRDYLKFILELRRRQFDLVIDFFSNPRSAQITFLTGAKHRIGFNFYGRAWVYTAKVTLLPSDKNLYSSLHKLKLLKPLGIENENCQIEFFCSSDDRKYAQEITEKLGITKDDFVISICPASRRKYRVLPAEKFAWIADRLIEKYNAKILFICGSNEKHFITDIKNKMKYRDRTLVACEIPTISQVRALFEKVHLSLGADNGLKHIAVAAHTPTVTVFGPSNPFNWTPPENKLHRFVAYDPGCRENCNLDKCRDYRCINEVSEIEYLSKIEETIEELGLINRNSPTL